MKIFRDYCRREDREKKKKRKGKKCVFWVFRSGCICDFIKVVILNRSFVKFKLDWISLWKGEVRIKCILDKDIMVIFCGDKRVSFLKIYNEYICMYLIFLCCILIIIY